MLIKPINLTLNFRPQTTFIFSYFVEKESMGEREGVGRVERGETVRMVREEEMVKARREGEGMTL